MMLLTGYRAARKKISDASGRIQLGVSRLHVTRARQ